MQTVKCVGVTGDGVRQKGTGVAGGEQMSRVPAYQGALKRGARKQYFSRRKSAPAHSSYSYPGLAQLNAESA
jgi:hypothetical protein